VEFARQENRPIQIRLAPGERTMSLVPFGFNLGLRWALRALWDGATVVVLSPKMANAPGVFETADRHGVTVIMATPRHLSLLLDGFKDDGLRLPHLRCLAVTSAALSEPVFAGVRRRISPNILLIYGTNETWCIAAATADLVERHPGTVGYLTENVALEIVDKQSLVPLPPGMLGEVRVRTPGMTDGYIDNPEADAKHFQDGWFYPGDAGLIDSDGLVYLKGRSDEVLNFDGILVGPQDIENVALQFPGISEAAAFGVPSATRGDLPFLAVVGDEAMDAQALLAHCRTRLGSRAPVRILQVDALPRNALGKVLRRELARLALKNIAEQVRRQ
jgi:acyl-CoA synthetase (AMP-forming)/AMP-acid ligase II